MAANDPCHKRWSRAAVRTTAATALAASALVLLAGTRSEATGEPIASTLDVAAAAIAWVHRFDGAAGDAAPLLEILDRHRSDSGVEWTLIRRSDDGRLALFERRVGSDRWWLHLATRSDVAAESPRLSDPRSRSAWRLRPIVRPVPVPAGGGRHLRNELQRWRQRDAG